jgi:ribosomal protein S18 acetylase RimI-like enzyme
LENRGVSHPPAILSSMIKPHRVADVGLVVRAQYRRQGVGNLLMQAAHDWAVEQGAEVMQLDCHANNQAAIHLYEKLGYRITGYFMTRYLSSENTDP